MLHIAPIDRWEAEADLYIDPSLQTEGFIHCSTAAQVTIPANERFRGRTDLVLLVIDVDQVPSDVVFEDCYETGQTFPHIYGPIPRSAVTQVIRFLPDADGWFTLPAELHDGTTADGPASD